MESLIPMLNAIDSFMWGPPLITLLVGTGIYLTVRLGLIQVFKLPTALRLIFSAKNNGEGDVSSFKALCVALAATVGTGNIVGVATAVKVGGPGAIFWMWVAAFFGMATKYSEGLLAVKYRSVDEKGEIAGGPMFYIKNGMGEKWKPLATFFALACIGVAYFGIGTFPQVNAIVDSMELSFGFPKIATDAILTFFIENHPVHGIPLHRHFLRPHRRGLHAHSRSHRHDCRKRFHGHGSRRRFRRLDHHDGHAERHRARRILE